MFATVYMENGYSIRILVDHATKMPTPCLNAFVEQQSDDQVIWLSPTLVYRH